jgi:hypothetical protein
MVSPLFADIRGAACWSGHPSFLITTGGVQLVIRKETAAAIKMLDVVNFINFLQKSI